MKWLKELLHSIFWFGEAEPTEVIKYRVDVPDWTAENAAVWHDFLKSHDGEILAQHLKKYQIQVCEWAVDLTDKDSNQDMKYRAGIALGVKLTQDYLLSMSRSNAKVTKEISPQQMEKFYKSRLGLFKS